ncbi:MAG: hypothetical protein ACRDV0_00560, partial [Acidimicrobiales bacterium]
MVRLRLPRTTHRFWRGYLTIVVLVGALGGVSLAAAANARRTSSSFATFFASTDPSTLSVIPAPANPNDNYSPAVSAALSRLPGLRHVESAVFVGGYVLNRLGVPSATEFQNTNSWVQGSVDGLYFTQDRLTVLRGRMSNPRSVDEIVVSPLAAARHHLHLGSVVSFGFYTNAQQANASFLKVTASGAPLITPTLTVRARVVGIAQSNTGVVADDVDQREIVLFTPALTHRLLTSDLANTVGWTDYGLQLNGGSAAIAPAQRAVAAALPSKVSLIFQEPTLDETAAARAIAPFTISLVVASLLSALALVLVMLQVVSRLFQAGAREREALRALGASPVMILADDLTGVIASLVLGVMVAVAVAFAASPLAPIGPLRSVFPSRGLYADTPVFALGAVGMLVVLVVLASAAGAAANPARVARRARRRPVRGSG